MSEAEGEIQREFEASLERLRPLKTELARTDALIDKIVYRLYGLTGEEIELIERCIRHLSSIGIDDVIVDDRGSTDGTLDLLRNLARSKPGIQLVEHSPQDAIHPSVAAAKHLARLRDLETDWAIFLDADMLLVKLRSDVETAVLEGRIDAVGPLATLEPRYRLSDQVPDDRQSAAASPRAVAASGSDRLTRSGIAVGTSTYWDDATRARVRRRSQPSRPGTVAMFASTVRCGATGRSFRSWKLCSAARDGG